MKLGSVNFEKKGKVAVITLDEPKKLNALSSDIRQGVLESLAKIEDDDEIRVAIITGSGDKAFCAGADISNFSFEPNDVSSFLREIFSFLTAAERCSKPIIAAINGLTLGGGFEFAISCDFIISSDQAKFGVPEIHIGLLPGFALVRLAELVGRAKAKEMSMLGETISAATACDLGIALKVVPHEQLMDEAMAFAKKIAAKPRMAISMAKSAYNRGLGGDDIRYATDAFPFLFMNEDTHEGITAFREKRKPNFKS